MSIHATKSIEQITREQLGEEGTGGLKRVLGPSELIMLGVGAAFAGGLVLALLIRRLVR